MCPSYLFSEVGTYEDADSGEQRQCRHDDMKLTDSGNKQLLVMPTEQLTD